jgi:hypothetical protein
MAEWRQLGPLGVFLDIITYISTPKQYDSFSTFQQLALAEDPTNNDALLLAVVKACVPAGIATVLPLSAGLSSNNLLPATPNTTLNG